MKRISKLIALCLSVVCLLSLFAGTGIAAPSKEAPKQTAEIISAEEQGTALTEQPQVNGSNDKLIALTFDDGPGRNTAQLLDGLRKRGVHCTFFVVGQYAKAYPSTIRQCYEDGHQLASHSYTHAWLTKLTDSEIRTEMQKTTDAVNAAVGCNLTLMVRPPYGAYNSHVLSVLGVPAFYWSDDSGDWWSGATADSVYNNTIKTAGDGDILLLHDSHSWSCEAALRIVDTLMAKGYEFVTLSELFRRRGVKLEAGHIYSYLRANGTNLPAISKPKISMTATEDGMLITMTSDPGTKIWYTTDGTVPNAASKVYSGPFVLTDAATVTAVAGYDMNGSRSGRTQLSIPKMRACQAPVITVEGGIASITAPDTIYYTIDGSEPTGSSAVYSGSFEVKPGTVIKAMAYAGTADTVKSKTVTLYYSENGNLFDDVLPQQWFANAADLAVTNGWMVGTDTNHFAPGQTVSRAQLMTVLWNLSGKPSPKHQSKFPDVPKGKWFTKAVVWAEENGMTAGYPDGCFHPEITVTREQTAVILRKFAEFNDFDTSAQASLDKFGDADQTADYALEAVSWAAAEGLFAGNDNGLLMPKSILFRSQLACILVTYKATEATWEKIHLTDEQLLALANDILSLFKEKYFEQLAVYLHPELGLTFTPYSAVGEADLTILPDEFTSAAASDEIRSWGYYDGSGDEILLSFSDFWDRFVWNADFSAADTVAANKITVCGNSIENVTEAYDDCLFVEYAVNSQYGYDDGTDWTTLKLVFTRYENRWYLTGVIHGEWTA